MDLVPVYNSTHLTEIAVIKSKLEAGGIYLFVQNYEHAQMAHIDILALGGMNILVPEDQVELARQIIEDDSDEFIDTDIFDNYEPPIALRNPTPYKASIWPVALMIAAAVAIIIFSSADVVAVLILALAGLLFHAQRSATQIQNKKGPQI